MGMIRTQDMVPEVYVNGSRDFEMLCNLFDSLLNPSKFYADSMLNITDTATINSDMLNLLSTKVGFESKKTFNDTELRFILQALPHLIRGKGSLGAVKKLLDTCLKLYNVSAKYEVSITTESTVIGKISLDAHTLVIGIESILDSTELIREVGKYILPTGFSLYIYFYQGMALTNFVQYQDCLELLFSSDNINSSLRPYKGEMYYENVLAKVDTSLDTVGDIQKYHVTRPGKTTETISIFTPNFYIRFHFNDYTVTYEVLTDEDLHVAIIRDCSSIQEAEEKFRIRYPEATRIQSIVRNEYSEILEGYGTDEKKAVKEFLEQHEGAVIAQIVRDDTVAQDLIGSVGNMWVYTKNLSPMEAQKGQFRGIVQDKLTIENPQSGDVCISWKLDGEYKSYTTYLYQDNSWHELNFLGTYDSLTNLNKKQYDVVAVANKNMLMNTSSTWTDITDNYQGKFDYQQDIPSLPINSIVYVKSQERYFINTTDGWKTVINRGTFFTQSELNKLAPTAKMFEVVDVLGVTYGIFSTRAEAEEYIRQHPDKDYGEIVNAQNIATIYGARYFIYINGKWENYTYPMYNMKSYFVEGANQDEE